ncbi:MAG: glycerol-3-phosphate dehydrogenase/oxidase [Gammaproteobacteria bacterium]
MTRPDLPSRLDGLRERYDLVVVGGGIYGAALTWEATSRGLVTILLDKGDFASGTSANSLKVIHGGIRYLQDWNLARVRESSGERNALLRIAPHLVHPLECVIPTYSQPSKSRLALAAGIKVYDFATRGQGRGLAPDKQIKAGQTLSRDDLRAICPDLVGPGTTGAARWYDAQVFNSERLVLAFIMTAVRQGAHAHNYVTAKEYIVEDRTARGVLAQDRFSGRQHEIIGDAIVDCTGPWALRDTTFRRWVGPEQEARLAKAINLVVDRQVADCALGVKTTASGDGRLLFVTPWRHGSIVGTWYSAHAGSPDDLSITTDELAHYLAQINDALPSLNLTATDVTFAHVGMLPATQGPSVSGEPPLCKKPALMCAEEHGGPAGLYGVQGVKYTTARRVAQQVVDKLAGRLHGKVSRSSTATAPLYGGDVGDFTAFMRRCLARHGNSVAEPAIRRLAKNYGSNFDHIMGYAEHDPALLELVPGTADVIKAELYFGLDHEMAVTLSDVILRRTDIGSFSLPATETIDYCAELLRDYWGSDRQTRADNKDGLLACYPVWVRGESEPEQYLEADMVGEEMRQ